MKKVLIIITAFFLVGCSGQSDEQIKDLEEQVKKLEQNILTLEEQVKDHDNLASNQATLESQIAEQLSKLNELQKTLEEKEGIIETLEEDKDALLKSLSVVEFDPYEAQINFDINIVDSFNGFRYFLEPSLLPYAQIYNVIGANPVLNNINEANNMTITWGTDEQEVVSLKVEGEIYNVSWVSLEWNDNFTEYSVKDILEFKDVLKDQRLDVRTILPESLPNEMITFVNSRGEMFEILLGYDGLGFEGTIIITE